jgi:HD-GYP domain-containing protein (c-di-GMP phosphodiesterase class II)
MLKTIATHQVRKGMFIHSLKGAWIDHPFWKQAFKLTDSDDLKKLQASVIKEVVIDTSKGLDIVQTSPESVVESNLKEETPQIVVVEKSNVKRILASEEREQAKRAIDSSKKAVTSMFNDVRMGKAINTESAMPLVEEISASLSRNEGALISLVRLKVSDDYTYMHSVAVCALMVSLGRQLGLSEAEIKQVGLAGLLHDVGKAAIPLEILNKPGGLTTEEFNYIKLHPERGHELLIQGKMKDDVALEVCLHHHEKIDGSGYPHKLSGNQISLFAKMGAVCDVYDAITSNRPYKAGWEPGVSLQRMAQWKGHFDDLVFKAFVKSIGIYPIGSMVLLKSGYLAVVVDQSPNNLLTPIVKTFFSTKSKLRTPVKQIDLSKPSVFDEIVGHEDPALWGVTDINDIWLQND